MLLQINRSAMILGTSAFAIAACGSESNDNQPPGLTISFDHSAESQDETTQGSHAPRLSLEEGSIVVHLKDGATKTWREAMTQSSDAEQWSLLTQAYSEMNERRDTLAGTISAKSMTSEMPPALAAQLYASLSDIDSPKELRIPRDRRGWSALQKIVLSPKYSIAAAIIRSENPKTLTKLWNEFATLSQDDQHIIAMVADVTIDLNRVSALTEAAKVAKTDEIREYLINGANRIVAHALDDADKRIAAEQIAQRLQDRKLIRPLLLNALEDASER